MDLSVINHFLPMLLNLEEEGTSSPILVHEKVTFVYIKHNNLYCIPPLTPSRADWCLESSLFWDRLMSSICVCI